MIAAGCSYCAGKRGACSCTRDCGARPEPLPSPLNHWCPQAEGFLAWLEDTGFYSAAELARLRKRGYR